MQAFAFKKTRPHLPMHCAKCRQEQFYHDRFISPARNLTEKNFHRCAGRVSVYWGVGDVYCEKTGAAYAAWPYVSSTRVRQATTGERADVLKGSSPASTYTALLFTPARPHHASVERARSVCERERWRSQEVFIRGD